MPVSMMCMTTKQKFEVEDPDVVVLRNGRYAFKVECPWEGKNGKQLHAFKFCGSSDYEAFLARLATKCPENSQEASEKDAEPTGGGSE